MSARRLPRVFEGTATADVVLGVGLLLIGIADALTQAEYDGGRARLLVAVALQTLPLVWRRRRTLLVVLLSMLGLTVEVAGEEPYGGLYGLVGFLLLVHAAARWASGAAQAYAVGALVAGIGIRALSESVQGPLGWIGGVVMPLALAAVAWAVGSVGRVGAQRQEQLLERTEKHAAELEARAVAVVEAERTRISRELHDVVGHALAGISLTAGAAEQQSSVRDPELAKTLGLIRTLSRDAASDVRRLVALLREDQEAGLVEPLPTLDQIPALVERARAAGLDVEFVATGNPVSIPGGVHLAAYRTMQEGLTNLARHAPTARGTASVSWLPGRVEVCVENDAPSGDGPGKRDAHDEGGDGSGGRGLIGLAERVDIFDGSFSAGPTATGGYRLCAGFPLP